MRSYFTRCCLVLLLCGYAKFAASQDRRPLYDSVTNLVQAAYNRQEPAKVYSLTALAYQQKMKAATFSTGSQKFFTEMGKWEALHFKEVTGEGMTYLARFERGTQLFFLQLDEKSKILLFNFKPVPAAQYEKTYSVPSDNPMISATDSLVEKIARPYIQQKHTVGLSIAVIQNDVIHRYNYGEVRRGSGQLPDPATTLFEIGSVTKTFTALLLAREVIDGRMRLNDPISSYLPDSIPDLRYEGKAITLQQLSNHTSGFPRLPANIFGSVTDRADPYLNYDENLLYSFLMTYRPTSEPGTNFLYSNYGAGLLGSLIARKTQRAFENLVLEEICRPLKMNDTKITLRKKDSACFAQGYDEKGAPTAPWNFIALQGTGSIRSTLNDMITYILAQSGKHPAPPALQKAMRLTQQTTFQDKDNAIGLGWLIEQKGDHPYRHHAGGTGGFRSFVGFEENGRFGVVILSNTSEDVAPLGVSFFTQQKF